MGAVREVGWGCWHRADLPLLDLPNCQLGNSPEIWRDCFCHRSYVEAVSGVAVFVWTASTCPFSIGRIASLETWHRLQNGKSSLSNQYSVHRKLAMNIALHDRWHRLYVEAVLEVGIPVSVIISGQKQK